MVRPEETRSVYVVRRKAESRNCGRGGDEERSRLRVGVHGVSPGRAGGADYRLRRKGGENPRDGGEKDERKVGLGIVVHVRI